MACFVEVIVDLPLKEVDRPFDYQVPENLKDEISIGHQVLVPFGHQRLKGFVIALKEESEVKRVRPIYSLAHPETLFAEEMLPLIRWLASYYQSFLITAIQTIFPEVVRENSLEFIELIDEDVPLSKRAKKQASIREYLKKVGGRIPIKDVMDACDCKTRGPIDTLYKKGVIEILHKTKYRRPYREEDFLREGHLPLTSSQREALEEIEEGIKRREGETFLLHGVTGSGKTEVYLQAIDSVLKKGGGAILLVPEVSLTYQTVSRFKRRFGDEVALLHSYLSAGERFDEWLRIKRGEARVVIGARSAIFAPLSNLLLIVIDEEHEWSYKGGESPRYHAVKVARKRGEMEGVVTLLGSATPDMESYYQAESGTYRLLELKERIKRMPMPPVRTVDMRKELKGGNRTIISKYLYRSIEERLSRREQVLLFLNRRGFSNFLLCRRCGYVPRCTECDVSLTFHANPSRLYCHYCSHPYSLLDRCPQCGSRYLQYLGIGTQKVEEVVREEFPEATVARMDMDTTRKKGAHEAIIKSLFQGRIDILIGTQMIAKGHDHPNITLVGVILADTVLHFPDFRSSERTFQLLTQVAGRTGRGEKGGEVIIQTYSPDHYSIKAASDHNYSSFYSQEISLRESQEYPPFSKLINLIISSKEEGLCRDTAAKLGSLFTKHAKEGEGEIEIYGPAPATISRIRGHYRWQLLLKGSLNGDLQDVTRWIIEGFYPLLPEEVSLRVDVDPVSIV